MPHLMASSASSSSPTWTTTSWYQGICLSRVHSIGTSLEPTAYNTLMLRGESLPGVLQPRAAVT